MFKQNYAVDPLYHIRALRTCLLNEQKIVAQYEASSGQHGTAHVTGSSADSMLTIRCDMDECQRKVQLMDDELKMMHQKEESFVIQYQELQKRTHLVQQLQSNSHSSNDLHCAQQDVAQFEIIIKDSANELHQSWLNFIERLKGEFGGFYFVRQKSNDIDAREVRILLKRVYLYTHWIPSSRVHLRIPLY